MLTCIQCDETHPKCANCNVSQRSCSYENLVSAASALVPASRPKFKRTVKRKDESPISSDVSQSGAINDCPPVNKLHLELFHHFLTDIRSFLGLDKLSFEGSTIDLTSQILAAPFLMNQILAFSALHLSIVRPEKREYYQYHSSQLQTHALSEFNGQKLDISADNCIPIFLFSSCLAMHILADKIVFRPAGFEQFLDDFIHSLRMHRGVRAITTETWVLLLQSPLKSHLESEGLRLEQSTPGDECSGLLAHVDTMHDPVIRDIYRQVTKDLQRVYNATRSPSPDFSHIGPIMSWPVLLSSEYIDLLSEQRPEALVILAHFGVILLLHKHIWTFGDGGYYLISTIRSYLGPEWASWLLWPNRFI